MLIYLFMGGRWEGWDNKIMEEEEGKMGINNG